MDADKKSGGTWWGYGLAALGGFALGFAGGWVANDMSREAEQNPPQDNG